MERDEHELAADAVAGNGAAHESLLVRHYDRLVAHVAHKLPNQFRGLNAPADVPQEAFVVAFREVRGPRVDWRFGGRALQRRLRPQHLANDLQKTGSAAADSRAWAPGLRTRCRSASASPRPPAAGKPSADAAYAQEPATLTRTQPSSRD